MTDETQILTLTAQIPALRGFSGQPERMGGLTNRVYRMGEVVLRLPGAGTPGLEPELENVTKHPALLGQGIL
jgi:hypothetical protein